MEAWENKNFDAPLIGEQSVMSWRFNTVKIKKCTGQEKQDTEVLTICENVKCIDSHTRDK